MNYPLVSIIIPVYNVEKYLERCLTSVVNQTFQNIEIILVDDGSTDQSSNICDQWSEKDQRIKSLHKTNGGLSSARNYGLDAAAGKYIFFLDSDDWLSQDGIEKLFNCIEEYEVDFVRFRPVKNGFTDVEENSFVQYEKPREIEPGYYSRMDIENLLIPKMMITSQFTLAPILGTYSSLYSHDFIKDNNFRFYEDVRYSEDMNFSANIVYKARSFYYLDNVEIYHYFCNPNSISRSFHSGRWNSCKNIIKHFIEDYSHSNDLKISSQLERVKLFCFLMAWNEARFLDGVLPSAKYRFSILADPEFPVVSLKKADLDIPARLRLKIYILLIASNLLNWRR